jgi:hypothetical protein
MDHSQNRLHDEYPSWYAARVIELLFTLFILMRTYTMGSQKVPGLPLQTENER